MPDLLNCMCARFASITARCHHCADALPRAAGTPRHHGSGDSRSPRFRDRIARTSCGRRLPDIYIAGCSDGQAGSFDRPPRAGAGHRQLLPGSLVPVLHDRTRSLASGVRAGSRTRCSTDCDLAAAAATERLHCPTAFLEFSRAVGCRLSCCRDVRSGLFGAGANATTLAIDSDQHPVRSRRPGRSDVEAAIACDVCSET